jgi:proteasome lid subunit RPN8/RPN11
MARHRYSIELYPPNRTGWSIGLEKPDFQPAIEWGQFEALRAGHVPASGTSVVDPVFSNGGPAVAEFRITVPVAGGDFSLSLPYSYFSPVATRYRSAFVKSGKLTEAEECYWAISAWPSDEGIETESAVTGLNVNIESDSVANLLSRSKPNSHDDGSHFKAFIPRDVLDETADRAVSASPNECGGVLLGRLIRDPSTGELFQAITAFVPALHAVPSELELRFTPEAWHAVRAAVKLRGGHEIWCGWEHSHTPVSWRDQCGRCPVEKQRTCPLATQLFSEQDRALHRLFPSFCIALVANVLADGVVHSCFGWRLGGIEPRPFYILENHS